MDISSRRTFLQLAALAAPATSFGSLAAWGITPDTTPGTTVTPVRAWRTSDKARCERIEAPTWRSGAPAGSGAGSAAIQLHPDQSCQELVGFGAALTDCSCYPYTYDDTAQPDPDLTHFSIEHDRQYILPVLHETQQVNPEVFYFSSPWSPPAWMKAGDSLLGGSMRSRYFGPYAEYFVKFLQSYAADGVHIRAVTIQNEIDTDQGGRMPQCLWGQEYEIQFVKEYLGPALQKNSLDTKIWILDHNYNLWGRVADEFEDPDLSKYVDGAAWAGYYGAHAPRVRGVDTST